MKKLLVAGTIVSFLIAMYFLMFSPYQADQDNLEVAGTMIVLSAFLLSRWVIVENSDHQLSERIKSEYRDN
jgi:hypothetical protein